MRHYEVLLIPTFLLLDYLLTVLGARRSERRYRLHFKLPHYELNPMWQKSIAKKRWFNPQFLAMLVVISLLSLYWLHFWTDQDPLMEFGAGFALIVQATVIGSHVSNFLLFRHADKCPEDVSGEVTLTHRWSLAASQSRLFTVLLPLVVISTLCGSMFIYGGMFGIVALMLIHGLWRWKSRSAQEVAPAQSQSA